MIFIFNYRSFLSREV